MISHAMLQALFGFNQAMNERLWRIIMEHLSEAQFVQTDGYSQGSIRNQMVHMADAEHYWLRGLLNRTDLLELDAEGYGTRAPARDVCRLADQTCLHTVRRLTEAEVERVPDGWSQPLWVGLLQLAHHGTDHRAQILRALHDLGAPTFEQNFAVYMENVTPMSVRALAAHIGAKRAEWDDLLRQMPAERMDEPMLERWTVREAIAILTWKERRAAEMMRRRVVVGTSFGQLPPAEQARILEASRALPLPALLEQHRAAHRELLDALRGLSDDDLNAEGVEGLPPEERFWKAIAWTTWWSYPDFAEALRQLLAEDASGPANVYSSS